MNEFFDNDFTPEKKSRKKRRFNGRLLGFLVLIAAIAAAGYFYNHNRQQKTPAADQKSEQSQEIKQYLKELGQMIELPADEEPSVATVVDRDKVKDERFFQNAEVGDKVFIFSKTKKAVLYRPSSKRIIEVASVLDLGETPNPSSSPAAISALPKVALLNGTTTPGITGSIEEKITGSMSSVEIGPKDKANKQNYGQSLVIDLTGSNSLLVKEIAALLNADEATLPAGEKRPDADIVVIIGADNL